MNQKDARGAVYIITQRQEYIGLLKTSVESLKKVMPDLPITVFSQFPIDCPQAERIIPVEASNDGFFDKTRFLQDSPHEQTIFLDADTHILEPFDELFDLLDHFDVAVTHEEYVNTDWMKRYPRPDIPAAYPEFNTGVLVFRRSPNVQEMLIRWLDLFTLFRADKPGQRAGDQLFFRVAMYYSKVRVATLTREYNCKFRGQGYLNGKVKVLHGHHKLRLDPDYVARVNKAMNASTRPRVYIAGKVYEFRDDGVLEGKRVGRLVGQFPEPPEWIWKLRYEVLQKRLGAEGWAPFVRRLVKSRLVGG